MMWQARGFNELLEGAHNGDADAQFRLGLGYATGKFTVDHKPDDQEAEKWWTKASEQGHIDARVHIGILRDADGKHEEAVKIWKGPAKRGNVTAQSNLGILYQRGAPGFRRDEKEAIKWLTKAAAQGEPEAQNNLAVCYFPKDPKKARDLWKKSAVQGYAPALANLGTLFRDGARGIPKDYVKAASWLRTAVRMGYAEAYLILGDIYRDGGYGVQRDYGLAYKYYDRASRLPDSVGTVYSSHTLKKGRDGNLDSLNMHDLARKRLEALDKVTGI